MNTYNEIDFKSGLNFSFKFDDSMDADLRSAIVDTFDEFHVDQAEITEDTYQMLNEEVATGFLIACKGDGNDDDDDDFEFPEHENYYPVVENAIRLSANDVIVCVTFMDVADADSSSESEDEWD